MANPLLPRRMVALYSQQQLRRFQQSSQEWTRLPVWARDQSKRPTKRCIVGMHSTADLRCIQCHVNQTTLHTQNQNIPSIHLFVGRGVRSMDCSLRFAVGFAAVVLDVHRPLVQPLAGVLVVEDGHTVVAVLAPALAVKSNLIDREKNG